MPSRILHTAWLLLPMDGSPPMRDAAVMVDDEGRVLKITTTLACGLDVDERHDHQVLMPGVVNAHVHLTDAGRSEPVPGGDGLVKWVRRLQAQRSDMPIDRVGETIDRMRSKGTVAIGEVANDFGTLEPIAASAIRCRFIHELIGFRSERAEEIVRRTEQIPDTIERSSQIEYTVGAHAPYSVSPELMRHIDRRDRELGTHLFQHLAEDPDERRLYRDADGPWKEYLQEVGAWDDRWQATGMSPIEYYERAGLLSDRFVAVHLADANDEELALLARRGVRATLSPTSNLHITGLMPNFESIVDQGMEFALGTDGKGSNPSIDVFDEARQLLERWPDLKPGAVLEALTTAGARILQFDELGSITPGKRPGLVAVSVDEIGETMSDWEQAIVLEARGRRIVA